MMLTAIPVGFFAGLFGIGGGLISVPFLFFLFDSVVYVSFGAFLFVFAVFSGFSGIFRRFFWNFLDFPDFPGFFLISFNCLSVWVVSLDRVWSKAGSYSYVVNKRRRSYEFILLKKP